LAAIGADTSGLQDKALIRLLIASGARAASLIKMRVNEHVHEITTPLDDMPALRMEIPGSKVPNGEAYHAYISGDAYNDIMAWVERRRRLYPRCPYLFCTGVGSQLSTCGITMMLSRLSEKAGYGYGFFTAHSGRMGYACRRAAYEYCRGNSTHDVLDELATLGHWAFGSPVILSYVKTSIQRFFFNNRSISWEEFQALPPTVLHELDGLGNVENRGNTRYKQDLTVLHRICASLDLQHLLNSQDQYLIRRQIARRMYRDNSAFRLYVDSINPSGRGGDFAIKVVPLLVEHRMLGFGRPFENLTREELDMITRAIAYRQPGGVPRDQDGRRIRRPQAAQLPRQVRHHEVETLEEARALRRRLRRRYADRQVNIVYFADGREAVLTYPPRDANVVHVRNLPLVPPDSDDDITLSISSTSSSDNEEVFPIPVIDLTSSRSSSSDDEVNSPDVPSDNDESNYMTPPPKRRNISTTPSTRATPY
jgi:hypothetical protein